MSTTANKKAAGVDNTARRTWDKSEYEDRAKEREDEVRGKGVEWLVSWLA